MEEWRGEGDSIVAHTSGSTGSPKEIHLRKDFVRDSALRTNSFFGITSGSHLHSCVAPDFIGGKMMAVRSEVAGCRFTWETPSNTPLKEMARDEKIHLLAVVPSQMLHILDNLRDMPEIDAVIIGGSAIHPSLLRRIAASGLNAYETYGMTETASHIALRKIDGASGRFTTLPGISVELDGRGCLVILFHSGEKVVTNDLARIHGDNEFEILGRFDHIIITGGKKVNPLEVELKISHLINAPFIITSQPDEKWGSRIVLKIEGEAKPTDELEAELRKSLQGWEMPKAIKFVASLPRTSNGKILR